MGGDIFGGHGVAKSTSDEFADNLTSIASMVPGPIGAAATIMEVRRDWGDWGKVGTDLVETAPYVGPVLTTGSFLASDQANQQEQSEEETSSDERNVPLVTPDMLQAAHGHYTD